MNYRFTIQYDGTRYDGWQRQGNTENTIQGKLEKVLSALAGECVEIQGAGRTDAGVHALAQVASGKLPGERTPGEILNYVNRYLPEDIAVIAVEAAPERFHARLNARGKEYRYELRLGAVSQFATQDFQNTPNLMDIWIDNKTVEQIKQVAPEGNIVAGYGARFPWDANAGCRFHGTNGIVLGNGTIIHE